MVLDSEQSRRPKSGHDAVFEGGWEQASCLARMRSRTYPSAIAFHEMAKSKKRTKQTLTKDNKKRKLETALEISGPMPLGDFWVEADYGKQVLEPFVNAPSKATKKEVTIAAEKMRAAYGAFPLSLLDGSGFDGSFLEQTIKSPGLIEPTIKNSDLLAGIKAGLAKETI
ncbi:hypothetical protein BDK51DRAFT_29032 [Blyttiomyces helicus]|uniref:Uncharacterized protein n=1 Tax=Blyttiomyces helicus TaxID=388810 RepID=A0A4P9WQK4_9FUNG|nr:hypothetical protein BDK51DRAFT_29032 [Blyttiomyces helicus]|eukprot:RKO94675.1 hypothetical protein BDK51DRAFT_29032 [Blyttiomyces helicus]